MRPRTLRTRIKERLDFEPLAEPRGGEEEGVAGAAKASSAHTQGVHPIATHLINCVLGALSEPFKRNSKRGPRSMRVARYRS